MEALPGGHKTQRALTFATFNEKSPALGLDQAAASKSGQRSVRTLPFSMDTFRLITDRFHTHGSISRVISRADIPVFSEADLRMRGDGGEEYPAHGMR